MNFQKMLNDVVSCLIQNTLQKCAKIMKIFV
jgi:hypothetical protein